MKNPSMLST
jgi:hypothetical protein